MGKVTKPTQAERRKSRKQALEQAAARAEAAAHAAAAHAADLEHLPPGERGEFEVCRACTSCSHAV